MAELGDLGSVLLSLFDTLVTLTHGETVGLLTQYDLV